mgnify:CR=1 FL=1
MTKKVFLLLTLGLLSANPVESQDEGLFATAQFGVVAYETTHGGSNRPFGETDDEAFSWAVGLGYRFSRHLGIRGMFERSTGHDNITRRLARGTPPPMPSLGLRETDVNNLSLVAMPRLPLGNSASIYATLGVQYWDADTGSLLPDDDGFEFLFGGGLDYALTERFSLGAEVQASAADYLAGRLVINYSF